MTNRINFNYKVTFLLSKFALSNLSPPVEPVFLAKAPSKKGGDFNLDRSKSPPLVHHQGLEPWTP